jgi:pyridoxamine 5'-phosphate oxidase
MDTIAAIRTEYSKMTLGKSDVDKNPITQFEKWLQAAISSDALEPTAFTLATANFKGMPSARTVLLKDVLNGGFVFFTNYNSNKGQDIAENNVVAMLFFWPELQRQVRIQGNVQKVDTAISDAYFKSRPRESQIGAWASPQSEVIANRPILENYYQDLVKKYEEKPIPTPPHWGGYTVKPSYLEFWQGRPSRLHDRICYTYNAGNWLIDRIAP